MRSTGYAVCGSGCSPLRFHLGKIWVAATRCRRVTALRVHGLIHEPAGHLLIVYDSVFECALFGFCLCLRVRAARFLATVKCHSFILILRVAATFQKNLDDFTILAVLRQFPKILRYPTNPRGGMCARTDALAEARRYAVKERVYNTEYTIHPRGLPNMHFCLRIL